MKKIHKNILVAALGLSSVAASTPVSPIDKKVKELFGDSPLTEAAQFALGAAAATYYYYLVAGKNTGQGTEREDEDIQDLSRALESNQKSTEGEFGFLDSKKIPITVYARNGDLYIYWKALEGTFLKVEGPEMKKEYDNLLKILYKYQPQPQHSEFGSMRAELIKYLNENSTLSDDNLFSDLPVVSEDSNKLINFGPVKL